MKGREYQRILQNAKVVSVENKKKMVETRKAESNLQMVASNDRKKEMQELELSRRNNEKPSDLEQARSLV